MKNVAVICEYNMFHNGHLKQIQQIRERYPGASITALMSGNYVQRGGLAILPKNVRAKAAHAAGGVNLVLELPFPFSLGTAEYFAMGAIRTLNMLGCADVLCFGSESGDLDYLRKTAERMSSHEFKMALEAKTDENRSTPVSFIKTQETVYRELYGENTKLQMNDTLAVEYLKALGATSSTVEPMTLKRSGLVTATLARKYYSEEKFDNLRDLVPEEAYNVYLKNKPVRTENIENAILSFFRMATPEELAVIADMTDGMESRLINAADQSTNIKEFIANAAHKKYTNAKIRRIILNAILGLREIDLKRPPVCVNLLLADQMGTKILRDTKKNRKVPVVTKAVQRKKFLSDEDYTRMYNADRLYTLALGAPSDTFIKMPPEIIK